jgi:hypothetical protein
VNNQKNFLDFIPVQNIDWKQDEAGKVYLISERTRNRMIKKLIEWFHRDQFFYIHLDDHGTAAWLAIDGKRTVSEVIAIMKAQFGENLEQADQRVSHFLGMLKRNDFIFFR